MKWKILLPLVLIVLVSGCLFRPPAEVKFSVDHTIVPPGGTFHLIVDVNNTGKVGLVGATLILGNDNFQIVQEPRFPTILKVGQSVQLVWILRAPERPGTYNLQVSLELRDELKRTWTGFYGHFRITVATEVNPPKSINLTLSAPSKVNGGSQFPVTVTIGNGFDSTVQILGINFNLLPGMRIVSAPSAPAELSPGQNVTLTYLISAPYTYRNGFISVVVDYSAMGSKESAAKSARITVLWRPWEERENVLMAAYGENYHWVKQRYLVDAYWLKRFNSTSIVEPERLKPIALRIIGNASSEVQAAERLYKWLLSNYTFGDVTTTLQPTRILQQDRISYTEGQILMTAMLRSIEVPARIVSLFNGTDCTIRPITEFYTADGWYVIDLKHGFIGTLDEYLASPYFPRIYQLVTEQGYRIVAQNPEKLIGHEHVDVTSQFTSNLEDRLLKVVLQRVQPGLRSKLTLVLNGLNRDERIYALFLFASAPKDDLNNVLASWSVSRIQKNVKTMYEFYKDMPWRDDFSYYWKVFKGEV
ncbi:transglutaminase domain-containing protein [Thermococcus sp.]